LRFRLSRFRHGSKREKSIIALGTDPHADWYDHLSVYGFFAGRINPGFGAAAPFVSLALAIAGGLWVIFGLHQNAGDRNQRGKQGEAAGKMISKRRTLRRLS